MIYYDIMSTTTTREALPRTGGAGAGCRRGVAGGMHTYIYSWISISQKKYIYIYIYIYI